MEEHGSSVCHYDTYETLNNAILPMSANTTERLVLVRGINMFFENLGGEDPIIAVNVFDAYVVPLGEGFKGNFRFKVDLIIASS
jgi:hypothetical protein